MHRRTHTQTPTHSKKCLLETLNDQCRDGQNGSTLQKLLPESVWLYFLLIDLFGSSTPLHVQYEHLMHTPGQPKRQPDSPVLLLLKWVLIIFHFLVGLFLLLCLTKRLKKSKRRACWLFFCPGIQNHSFGDEINRIGDSMDDT